MATKRRNNPLETARSAAVGYATVVLGIVCFLLALAIAIAGVRAVVGLNLAANTATTAQTTITVNPGDNGAT